LLVVVPSPSWPKLFLPQHLIAPPESSAHVCRPAATARTAASVEVTVLSTEKKTSQIFILW